MDQLDKQIIGFIAMEGSLRVTALASKIFDTCNKYEKEKNASALRYRLRRMLDHGLLQYDERTREYSLTECIICDRCTVILHDGEDIPIEMGPAILFRLHDADFLLLLQQP